MSFEVRIVDDGFAGVSSWWDPVLEASQRPSPFASFSWLSTWWQIYGGGKTLLVLRFEHAGEPVGGCAFYLLRRRLRGALPVTELRLVGDRFVGSEGLDLIVKQGLEKQAAQALAGFLEDQPIGRELLHFAGLRPDAVLLRDEAIPRASASIVRRVNRCPYVELQNGEAVVPIKKSFATRVARKSRGLLDRRGLRFSRCDTEDALRRALAALFDMHQKRWIERGETGSFVDPRKRSFYLNVAPKLLQDGRLELFALWEGEMARAVLFGASSGSRLFYLQSGFDQELSSYGPGNVLIYQILRNARARGFEQFDFMKGDDSYKYLWTREERSLLLLRGFGPSWRGKVARAGLVVEQRLSAWRRRRDVVSLASQGSR